MDLLYFLEELRTPLGNALFSAITFLGDETTFILVSLACFWCIDKLQGYYLMSVGLAGTTLNNFFKLVFRVPRPWVKDPAFTIVEGAREAATGYSFPSGHSQSSVGVFGGLARWNGRRWLRAVCIAVCVLVPFSRMYLGVHTPLDVFTGAAVALLLVFVMHPVVLRAQHRPGGMRILLAVMLVGAIILILFSSLYPFPTNVDAANLAHGAKSGWKMLGCVLGLWLAFEVERRWINFETKAVWWAQLLKLALGAGLLLGIKSGLKSAINALCGGMPFADGVRYFLIVAFAGCIWPLTFRFFARLGAKKADEKTEG